MFLTFLQHFKFIIVHKLLILLNEIEYVEEFKLLQTNIEKSEL